MISANRWLCLPGHCRGILSFNQGSSQSERSPRIADGDSLPKGSQDWYPHTMKKLISVFALVISLASGAFAGFALSNSMEEASFSSPSSSISEANFDFDLNSLKSDNVYQQIVVANWGTKDMTQVVASEMGSLRNRVDFLVEQQSTSSSLLAVAVVLLGVMTLLTAVNNFQGRKTNDEMPRSERPNESIQENGQIE